MQFDISGVIVTYKNNRTILKKAIESFLATNLNVKLYIVDNSPTPVLESLCNDKRIEYIFNNKNLGFGKAHNIIINSKTKLGKFHLVLNPDIYFEPGVLETLYRVMVNDNLIGLVMPKVLNPDESIQYLCKLLPTPLDFFGRRFIKIGKIFKNKNDIFELRHSGYNSVMNIPYLSGCFMFIRSSIFEEIGGFDKRIFMYIEDTDLTRRIHEKYKTLFYPDVHVYHHFAKGSHKRLLLLLYSIHGAFIYFNKYGWFFDKERSLINKRTLESIKGEM